MGLMPWQEVPPIRSFLGARLQDLTEPSIGLLSFISGVGPTMGTRIGGVALRKEEIDRADGQHAGPRSVRCCR